MGRLVLVLFGFVLVGGPLVLFSWHELSEALLGRVHPGRLAVAIALVPLLFLVLGRLGSYLRRLEEAEQPSIPGRRR
jgi:hypothetical protein